jgi:predicted transcriptional regulator
MNNALISIKPIYVNKLIEGEKTVEIRNRHINLLPDSRLWIYSTLPKACIQATVRVERVEVGTPTSIWCQYKDSIGVSKERYYHYINGSRSVAAIVMNNVWKLPIDITLQRLRKKVPGFHPPQFIKYLKDTDPLLLAIVSFLFHNLGYESCEKAGLIKLLQPTAKYCGGNALLKV